MASHEDILREIRQAKNKQPVPQTPQQPVQPVPQTPVQPTPQQPVQPVPQTPVQPTPQQPVQPVPQTPQQLEEGQRPKGQQPVVGVDVFPKSSVLVGPSHSTDMFVFRDLFVRDSAGRVVQNKGSDVTIKRVQESLILQAADDLKERYSGCSVKIGEHVYMIDSNNKVFTSYVTLVRYMSLSQMSDDMGVALARQMFLTKYPLGEHHSFNANVVKTDELDVYKLILATTLSKTTSADYLMEQVLHEVKTIKETTRLTQQSVNVNQSWLRRKIHGMMHVLSWLLLDRAGLVKTRIPKMLDDLNMVLSDNDIPKASDIIDLIGDAQAEREATKERTERMRGRAPIRRKDEGLGR